MRRAAANDDLPIHAGLSYLLLESGDLLRRDQLVVRAVHGPDLALDVPGIVELQRLWDKSRGEFEVRCLCSCPRIFSDPSDLIEARRLGLLKPGARSLRFMTRPGPRHRPRPTYDFPKIIMNNIDTGAPLNHNHFSLNIVERCGNRSSHDRSEPGPIMFNPRERQR